MAFDYKKGYKEFYMPAASPEIVRIPAMNYVAVSGVSGIRMRKPARRRTVILHPVKSERRRMHEGGSSKMTARGSRAAGSNFFDRTVRLEAAGV